MFLMLSGEGSSDMGGAGAGGHFSQPGPMAHIVDKLVYRKFEFSPLQWGLTFWVSRSELSEISRTQRLKPHLILPGAKREAGYAGYTKHAAALAWKAQRKEEEEGDRCLAVMFRDSDGTQSDSHNHWEQVVHASESGFAAMGFSTGVPMIPKPKQEAWLLCAKKEDPYAHCQLLEEESGNDHCPSPLKEQLATICGGEPTTEELCDWVIEGCVDVERISMPSFDRFKAAMNSALDELK